MKYNIQCPECKEHVTVSTRDAVKYQEAGVPVQLSFDCPECGKEIIGYPKNQRVKV